MLGAELAAVDDVGAELAAAVVLGPDLTGADDSAADGDAEAPAALVSEAAVDGLFEADAAAMMTMSAPNAMSPLSALCRAGQDLRFGPRGRCGPGGVCGGIAGCCCHGGGWVMLGRPGGGHGCPYDGC